MKNTHRRSFLQQAGAALAVTTVGTASAAGTMNRTSVALIGAGGMGTNHLRYLGKRDDVDIVAVCDVDRQRLAKAKDEVEKASGKRPTTYGDLRQVLDRKDVDAVFIATPDHWHAPAAILALDAGKHVYVEKPCCHNIREGRLMADAVKRTEKLLQVGTQSRSTECVADAIHRVRSGQIGEVLVAKAWNSQRRGSIGKTKPSQPPAHLDFKAWLGPAPEVPFRSNMLHAIWRWWYDFGCGDVGNDGVHDIDVALWGLGVTTHPVKVACLGQKLFFDDDQQFPDTQYAVCDYAPDAQGRRRQLIFEQRIWSPYHLDGYENGAAFYGTKGQLIIGHTVGWRMYGERNKLIAQRTGRADLTAHHSNFLACVRGEKKTLNADVTAGTLSAAIVHLANIAARRDGLVEFDPTKETITNDPQAAALVSRKYRAGHWAVPAGV